MPVSKTEIDEIRIQNFKFFPKLENPIKLNGNHLLLYGENGSGKSSIYWALYTLLESSNKDNIEDFKKYFNPTHDERLTNIFLKPGTESWVEPYIEITFKDGSQPFKVSFSETNINQNKDAQESNLSSDFINYRNLLSLYSFAHSEDIDLMGFFSYAVFPYVKIKDVKIGVEAVDGLTVDKFENSANMLLHIVNKGPKKNKKNKNSKDRYPITKEQEYKDFKAIVDGFRVGIADLLTYINTEGNEILKNDLESNFTFKLELDWERQIKQSKIHLNSSNELITVKKYKNKNTNLKESYFSKESFLLSEQKFTKPEFKIWLSITNYENEANVVLKPHSFLNEARLTALGLSIRLAVLKKSLSNDAKLKILVLDDLLVSLDMSNREKVFDLILNKYVNEYQLFIFTHDYQLFSLCKRKIQYSANTNWIYNEIYADETNKTPVILLSESYFAKACNHLKNFDYPAAGNYFRKATEDMFENLFPREVTIADSGEKRTTLKGYLDAAIKLYERVGLNTSLLYDLDNYLFLLLNPLSHRAVDSNVYKIELNRVKILIIQIIEEFKKLNFKELIAANNILVIQFVVDSSKTHEYFIKTTEPIYIYIQDDKNCLSNSKCKSYESSTIQNGGSPVIAKNEHYDECNIQILHKKIYEIKGKPYDDSFMTNVYHQDNITKTRKSLSQLVQSLSIEN